MEYISSTKTLGAKTLFATHYHELTELEGAISGVNNYCIAVKEQGDNIVFLRKIVKGGADKSYGIQVPSWRECRSRLSAGPRSWWRSFQTRIYGRARDCFRQQKRPAQTQRRTSGRGRSAADVDF